MIRGVDPPPPLTIDSNGRVSGLLHPAKYEHWGTDPETGEWVVVSVIRLPTRSDVFMRGGTGRIVYGVHPPLKVAPAEVIDYYDRLPSLVDVDEIAFDDDGAHIVGRFSDPGWESARYEVTHGRPSCDWRTVDNQLTLVGAILVNEPGFGYA